MAAKKSRSLKKGAAGCKKVLTNSKTGGKFCADGMRGSGGRKGPERRKAGMKIGSVIAVSTGGGGVALGKVVGVRRGRRGPRDFVKDVSLPMRPGAHASSPIVPAPRKSRRKFRTFAKATMSER